MPSIRGGSVALPDEGGGVMLPDEAGTAWFFGRPQATKNVNNMAIAVVLRHITIGRV